MTAKQVMVLMMVWCSALSRASLVTGLANTKWPPSSSLSRLLRLRGAGNSRGSAAPTVTVYMHGEPETPASDEARDLVGILRKHNIDFAAYDIGADELLRQDVSRSSNWKTFPQLHVNGRLLGDLGIVKELEQDDLLLSEIALFRSMPSLDTDAHTKSATQPDLRAAWSTAVQQDNDLIDEQDIVPDLDLKASPVCICACACACAMRMRMRVRVLCVCLCVCDDSTHYSWKVSMMLLR
jgi:glutaredoxin-related protein